MSLGEPIFLLLLALIPLGLLAARVAQSRRRKHAIRLPTAGMIAALIPREAAWKRVLPGALLAGSVAALAFALARPQVTVDVPVERASVMLIVDASGSMRASDVQPTRLDAARQAVNDFLDEAPPQMRVGLLSFSSAVETIQSPTTDHDAVREAAASVDAGGGTATGTAIAEALERIEKDRAVDQAPAAILLLSDGMASEGEDPVGVAEQASRAGVPISTVALGTPDGVVQLGPGGYSQPVPPDPETMAQIARVSGGQTFAATDASQLSGVYEEMGSKLGTEEQEREATAAFAFAGGLLLLGGLAAAVRRRDRLT